MRGVQKVLSLREVSVVGLNGGYRQDGHLVFSLRDAVKICACQVPLIDFLVLFGHSSFRYMNVMQGD